MEDFDRQMMLRALSLARKGLGKTSPNPAVGCVIVNGGGIVGEGWHRKAGTPHAEIHALHEAGGRAKGADVYVTLEPCSHFGKTPPCADALITAGVRRVVAAMVDPNPKVSGRGLEKLRASGIEVVTGLLERESRLLNEAFVKFVSTGLPFVTLKCALTMDGKIATGTGDSCWISGEHSRSFVHRLRGMVDAIMVGKGTVAADDPQLTCRIRGGKDPLRVIVDSGLTIPLAAKVLNLSSKAGTLIATASTQKKRISAYQKSGVEVMQCRTKGDVVDLMQLFHLLGQRGVQSILLEGGPTLAGEALRAGLIDKILFFYAPKLVGGEGPGPFSGAGIACMGDAIRLNDMTIRKFGRDYLFTAYTESKCSPV